ncbi:MAG: class I SAM-dependent methyltransferase [Pseudonocardia sp.]
MIQNTAVKKIVNTYWNNRARTYDASPGHDVRSADALDRWHDLLARSVGEPALDAVDVGCGTGFIAVLLAELGHHVVGVDQSPQMLELARAKAWDRTVEIDLRQGDADELPLSDDSVDVVAERHVLWTMCDPAATLTEWSRVLRAGGRLVLVEGDWRDRMTDAQLADHEPDFVRDYAAVRSELPLYGGRPAEQIAELVESAGFTEVAIEHLVEAELWEDTPDFAPHPGGRYLIRARHS